MLQVVYFLNYRKLIPTQNTGIPLSAAFKLEAKTVEFMLAEFPPEQISAHPASTEFPGLGWKSTEYGKIVHNQTVTIEPEVELVEEDTWKGSTFNSCVEINTGELDNSEPYKFHFDPITWHSTGTVILGESGLVGE